MLFFLGTKHFQKYLFAYRLPISSTTSSTTTLAKKQNNPYGEDTDVDSDSENVCYDILADESNASLPLIENVFKNCLFYLSTNLKPLIRKECYRYIIALEG